MRNGLHFSFVDFVMVAVANESCALKKEVNLILSNLRKFKKLLI